MKIEPGKKVTIHYRLFIGGFGAEMVEDTADQGPFSFQFKSGEILESLEDALDGKKSGEGFEVMIKSDDAYGPESEDAIIELNKSAFIVDGELDDTAIEVGEVIPLKDSEGNEFVGIVVENKLNTIVIDCNHPLAGEDLYFEGEVVSVE